MIKLVRKLKNNRATINMFGTQTRVDFNAEILGNKKHSYISLRMRCEDEHKGSRVTTDPLDHGIKLDPAKREMLVKGFSENEGVPAMLLKAGIITSCKDIDGRFFVCTLSENIPVSEF